MRSSILILSFLFCTITINSQSTQLRDESNQYDFVIITLSQFTETCELFKAHKESVRNLKTFVTTLDEILEEFNDSSTLQHNIREFISFAGTNWTEPTPKYFMFAGDIGSIPNFSFESIPGYEPSDTTRSDYFYGINIYEVDTTKLSFSIGRIAAKNETELTNYFNKVTNYESNPSVDEWNNNALFAADDGKTSHADNGDIFEQITLNLSEYLPESILNKFIFESDSSEFNGTTDSIISYINNIGISSLNFCGHGDDSIFTHEGFFTLDDVPRLNNHSRPFFVNFLFSNCFTSSSRTSIIDQMLLSEAGAFSAISPVGIVYVHANENNRNKIWNDLYSNISIGENLMTNIIPTTKRENQKYNVFGDPTIVLKFDPLADTKTIILQFPADYKLGQNYPNPFNPETTITYSIPKQEFVIIKVYNILGSEVATLINRNLSPGNYEIKFDASNLPSGTYFYRFTAGAYVETRKMLLLK